MAGIIRMRVQFPPMAQHFPDAAEFAAAAKRHHIIPVYRPVLADHLTPVTAFEVLGRDDHAFLLESVVGGERIARYSFIATSPTIVYEAAGNNAAIWETGKPPREFETNDPLADLAKLLPA